jgi:hypothetical protein
MGVAEYTVTTQLPKEISDKLPTAEELQREAKKINMK